MLKRMLLGLMTLALLMNAAFAFAETPDLSHMTFTELAELRARVNAEMLIRPEAEDIILPGGGEYVVGEDLLPGTYYFIYNDTSTGNISVEVYRDKSADWPENYINCNSDDYLVHTMSLEEGNCIRTRWTIRLNRILLDGSERKAIVTLNDGNTLVIQQGGIIVNKYKTTFTFD